VTWYDGSNEKTVEMYDYGDYGAVTITNWGPDRTFGTGDDANPSSSAIGNPYLFTARRYDPETTLYYYRARYMKSDTGRFISHDPVGYDDGMSLYEYCRSNPINVVDPLGLKSKKCCLGGGGSDGGGRGGGCGGSGAQEAVSAASLSLSHGVTPVFFGNAAADGAAGSLHAASARLKPPSHKGPFKKPPGKWIKRCLALFGATVMGNRFWCKSNLTCCTEFCSTTDKPSACHQVCNAAYALCVATPGTWSFPFVWPPRRPKPRWMKTTANPYGAK